MAVVSKDSLNHVRLSVVEVRYTCPSTPLRVTV